MNTHDQHSQGLRDWGKWLSRAHSLRRAALVLRREAQRDWDVRKKNRVASAQTAVDAPPGLDGVITMLNGLAVENMVKALWVQTNDPVKDKGGFVDRLSHNTIELLGDVNFQLSAEERDLLRRLETYVVWAGRYPMPKNHEKLQPQALCQVNGIKVPLYYSVFNDDERQVKNLIDRLEKLIAASK